MPNFLSQLTKGEQFARSWTKAKTGQHQLLTPEYAYLTDLKHRRADGDWKALRTAKARSLRPFLFTAMA